MVSCAILIWLCHDVLIVPCCSRCILMSYDGDDGCIYDVVILLWLYHDVLDALCCILYVNMPVVLTHVPQVIS